MTVRDIIAEPLEVMELVQTREEADQKVREIASKCRLNLEHLRRFPHAFSGGQRQRISIARTLVCSPNFVLQMKAWPLLMFPSRRTSLTCSSPPEQSRTDLLFISHDLSVVAHICDTVAVMYLELLSNQHRPFPFTQPKHPYTKALLSAIPTLNPKTGEKPRNLKEKSPARSILHRMPIPPGARW